VHTALAQSSGWVHFCPAWHFLQPPPQSAALSVPFFTPSEHDGARQRPVAGLQTPLAQSEPAPQSRSVPQRAHAKGPPQSMSVSCPFLTASLHEGD
jgi:hypothetical protein